jgi:tRNA-splicing ligase RtcB
VVATDIDAGGVISPGGVGFDINCGVRLIKTDLTGDEVKGHIKQLVDVLFMRVPAGVGSEGKIEVSDREQKRIFTKGAGWAVEKGYGWEEDLEYCEQRGAVKEADPGKVSAKAYIRGRKQPGTLGSGNHFLEVQIVDEVYDRGIADIFGIKEGLVTIMIHTGSRGTGHQICGDYAEKMIGSLKKYSINMPDKQLACVPVNSPEGGDYLGAMRAAANYAWNNRQIITHLVRESFEKVFGESAVSLGMRLIYDVTHNMARIEEYEINGSKRRLCVHRKGATRAFGPGHDEVPLKYREAGQPVIIPGDMGSCSYLLVGTARAEETFYSTCHGAGRLMSRKAAIKATKGRAIQRELADRNIFIRYRGRDTLREEVSDAYKDVSQVVEVVHNAGLSSKIAKMRPLGVIKG